MERLLAVAAINTYTKAPGVEEDGGAFMDGRTGCSDKQRTFQSAAALKISIYSLHAAVRIDVRLGTFSRGFRGRTTKNAAAPSVVEVTASVLHRWNELGKRRCLTRKCFEA